jgi:hypothetical protein
MEAEQTTILEVILHKDGGIEFRVELKETGINHLTLIGVLEQLKMDILSDQSAVNRQPEPSTNQKYDA